MAYWRNGCLNMNPTLQHSVTPPLPFFSFSTAASILFGSGRRAELPALVSSLGTRLLLVTGKSGRGAEGLNPALHLCVAGEPTFGLIRAHAAAARAARCDVVAAIGGGSVLEGAAVLPAAPVQDNSTASQIPGNAPAGTPASGAPATPAAPIK